MKKEIELKNGVLINGKTVKKLSYDDEEITLDDYAEADRQRAEKARSKSGVSMNLAEFDNTFHFYLGVAAIVAVNPDIDKADVERVKGADIVKVCRIGRDFLLQSGGEQAESQSEDLSEPMPDCSIQA